MRSPREMSMLHSWWVVAWAQPAKLPKSTLLEQCRLRAYATPEMAFYPRCEDTLMPPCLTVLWLPRISALPRIASRTFHEFLQCSREFHSSPPPADFAAVKWDEICQTRFELKTWSICLQTVLIYSILVFLWVALRWRVFILGEAELAFFWKPSKSSKLSSLPN